MVSRTKTKRTLQTSSLPRSLLLLLFFPVLVLGADELTGNPSDESGREYLSLIRSAGGLTEAISALASIEQELEPSEAVSLYRHVAGIAELSGALDDALRYYHRAADLGDEESALSAASVLFELGRLGEAESKARILVLGAESFRVRRRATALVARCMQTTDRLTQAVTLLSTVAAIEEREHLEPEVLLLLYEIAVQAGRAGTAEAARSKLLELFPNSVEAVLLEDRVIGVELYPSLPTLLASPTTTPGPDGEVGEPPEDAGGLPATAATEAAGVQTGSFRDRENAEYMARDLRRIGFRAEVLVAQRNGAPLYKVVVRTDDIDANAHALLMRLKNRGVEGFLLF